MARVATMARPQLTTLDTTIEERLTLESFEVSIAPESALPAELSDATQDKFDLRDFIGAVSEKLIARSQEDSGREYNCVVAAILLILAVTDSCARIAFDPKPFISTFEATVDKLINVRKELLKKTENMEKSMRSAEKEFSSKMVQLNSNFEV